MSRLNWLMIMMRIHTSRSISQPLDHVESGGNGEKQDENGLGLWKSR